MDIVNLKETEIEKDFEVWIDKDLKWSQKCRKSASQAMSVLEMIKRSFKHIHVDVDVESIKTLYNTLYSVTSRILCPSLEPIP